MAVENVTPNSYTPNLTFSQATGTATGFQTKLVVKKVDGTIFDFTGYNTGNLFMATPVLDTPDTTTAGSLVIGTADATGIVISMIPAVAATLFHATNNAAPQYTIELGDGANTVVAAIGTIRLQLLP